MNPEKIIQFIQYAALWMLVLFTAYMIIQRIETMILKSISAWAKASWDIHQAKTIRHKAQDEIDRLEANR